MNNAENSFSLAISDRTDEKESSIEFSGTSAVLGIALIAFGPGMHMQVRNKRPFNQYQ